MAVHYKFRAAMDYSSIPVDGMHISLADLKENIMKVACMPNNQDLIVQNAETSEDYKNDKDLIRRGTSVLVYRIPAAFSTYKQAPKVKRRPVPTKTTLGLRTAGANKAAEAAAWQLDPANRVQDPKASVEGYRLEKIAKSNTDLTLMTGTEEEKLEVMRAQSTLAYHPSRYLHRNLLKRPTRASATDKCPHCLQFGHFVRDCPLKKAGVNKVCGVPMSRLRRITDPSTPGAMITPLGQLVVYKCSEDSSNPPPKHDPEDKLIPLLEDLCCSLCEDLFNEPMMVPCCHVVYCYECIRDHLTIKDTENCPSCTEPTLNIGKLINSEYYRNKVKDFDTFTKGKYIRTCDSRYVEVLKKSNLTLENIPSTEETEKKSSVVLENNIGDGTEISRDENKTKLSESLKIEIFLEKYGNIVENSNRSSTTEKNLQLLDATALTLVRDKTCESDRHNSSDEYSPSKNDEQINFFDNEETNRQLIDLSQSRARLRSPHAHCSSHRSPSAHYGISSSQRRTHHNSPMRANSSLCHHRQSRSPYRHHRKSRSPYRQRQESGFTYRHHQKQPHSPRPHVMDKLRYAAASTASTRGQRREEISRTAQYQNDCLPLSHHGRASAVCPRADLRHSRDHSRNAQSPRIYRIDESMFVNDSRIRDKYETYKRSWHSRERVNGDGGRNRSSYHVEVESRGKVGERIAKKPKDCEGRSENRCSKENTTRSKNCESRVTVYTKRAEEKRGTKRSIAQVLDAREFKKRKHH